MKKILINLSQHILIIVLFIVISSIYFYPAISGKVLSQMDDNHVRGMAKEVVDFEKKTGEHSFWTNSMFGGMPTYQIKGGKKYNIYSSIRQALRLGLHPTTISILFIYLIGFYFLLISLKIHKWLSFVGAIAFALSSYNIIIILAGHITKCYAIAYMAPVLAGFLFIFDKKYLLGGIIAAVSLGIQISTSHIQIVYYTGLLVGLLFIFKFIFAIKDKQIKVFGISSAIAIAAVLLAILPNIMLMMRTQELGEYSTRGKRELTDKKTENSSGLDKSYALAWSYGVGETFTFLIPNTKGGGSDYIGNNEELMKKIDSEYKEFIGQSSMYWGNQPFTSGPVYFGAIIIFLFILGLLISKNKLKWWLLAGTILSVLLSWGQNFEFFTDLFFNYVPFYNKFRTVSMVLVIASVTMPLLAFITLKEIIEDPKIIKKNIYMFAIAFGLTGGLALIFWLVPSIFPFMSNQELTYFQDIRNQSPEAVSQINGFIADLEAVRISIFKADAIRSFAFILFSGLALFLFSYFDKFKKEYLFVILGILIMADMWTIDVRYLSPDMFQRKSKVAEQFNPTPADKAILKDKDPNYRVLNITKSVFNDAFTPYFHKSIGGYHGAKLRRYQNVIDYYLAPSVEMLRRASQDTSANMNQLLSSLQVLNMLNTKYIIDNPNVFPMANMNTFGNAWFVDNYKLVETADEEIKSLGEINLKRSVIINKKKFANYKLPEIKISANDSGSIYLTSYKPNEIIYKSKSTKEEFAVFSEIYYPKGWHAYIDDKEVEHINVNYILRGLKVPAGEHTIKFKFDPKSYYIGKTIAIASSTIILLLILGIIAKILFDMYKKEKLFKKNENEEKKK